MRLARHVVIRINSPLRGSHTTPHVSSRPPTQHLFTPGLSKRRHLQRVFSEVDNPMDEHDGNGGTEQVSERSIRIHEIADGAVSHVANDVLDGTFCDGIL